MPKEQPDSKFEQLQSGWLTSLTDPENHNPEDYRYLIHAFNTNKTSMALISAFTEQKYSQSGQKVEQTPVVDLLQSPERLRERGD